MAMVRKIAIYTRLSPNPTKDDTEGQERQLIDFCNGQGWEIVEVYRDILVSGGKKGVDRPQFKRLMEDAHKGRFNMLLFWSLDRLSREGVLETLTYLKTLGDWGIDYRSYSEQWLDSCGIFKDAIVGILATVAKQERVRIQERTMVGLERAKLKGVKLGRPKAMIDLARAKEMRDSGIKLVKIAAEFDVSEATISRLLRDSGQEVELA